MFVMSLISNTKFFSILSIENGVNIEIKIKKKINSEFIFSENSKEPNPF